MTCGERSLAYAAAATHPNELRALRVLCAGCNQHWRVAGPPSAKDVRFVPVRVSGPERGGAA